MNLRLTSSAIALAAMTAPAMADVTPEQVWQSWVDYYQSFGYTIEEGNRDLAGETLTLTDVVATMDENDSKVSFDFDKITLTGTGDGNVRTVFAERSIGTVSGTNPDGVEFSMPITLDMPGNATVTSGEPGNLVHEFNYPTVDIVLTSVTTDGKETPVPIRVGIVNSTGSVNMGGTENPQYDYTLNSERLTFTGNIDGENGEKFKFDGNLAGLESTGKMFMPAGQTLDADVNQALKSGMTMDGMLKSGPMTMSFDVNDPAPEAPQSGTGSYDGQGFEVTYALSQDGLVYQGSADAFSAEMTLSSFPMPITYAAESGSFDVQFPVMKSEELAPFKFAYSVAGLTIGDAIWNLFDPQAKLPRDPASLDLDLTGKLRVNEDMFDPELMMPPADPASPEAMTRPEPIEALELDINQFALAMMGARITAEGQLKGPEGRPISEIEPPIGELRATYEGLNGLLDTLGEMGLIPEDQLMSARMMLTLFARPAEGDDNMTTDLEFREDGSIFANGQQIK